MVLRGQNVKKWHVKIFVVTKKVGTRKYFCPSPKKMETQKMGYHVLQNTLGLLRLFGIMRCGIFYKRTW